jgi:hypothetical protein
MARVSYPQSNFTTGEISPRLHGRVDIPQYGNAAKALFNCYPVIHGGSKRRGGMRFCKAAKYAAKRTRKIPFVFSRDAAYMLEFGDLYVRIFKAGGVDLGVELVTPYTEAMLPDLDYVKGESTMFISHPSVPIQRLRRFGDTTWDLSDAPFLVTPFAEQGHALASNATLSLATVGAGRTLTAASGVFLPSDVGRALVSGAGLATVTGYTSATVLTVTIVIAFASTALASGAWTLDVSPQALLKPSAKDPVASSIDLHAGLSRAANLTLSAKTGAITITASAAVFAPADSGKVLYADSGEVTLTYSTPTTCTGTTTSDFISTTYALGGYGITDSAWRAEDVGKFVTLNGGLLKITSFVSASNVKATILTAMSSTVAAPALSWTLESSVWSAANGYPRTVTLHEQRLIAAGSTKLPLTIWGSRTGEYLDFTKGTNDDDSFSFTLASDDVDPIAYVSSLRTLIVNTYGGEFSLQGGIEKPITPTNVRIRPESALGCKGVRPVLVGKESVFVQRAGRKVRTLSYDYAKDGYVSPDIAVLAEHLTLGGITELAYQQEPDFILWGVRADGVLLSCTFNRDPVVGVTAWAPHYTEGAVESVACIPSADGDRDELWLTVRRSVNGSIVRYNEIMNDTFEPLLPGPVDPDAFPPISAPVVYGYTVDSGLDFDNAAGQTVFNVPHLIGKTVDIVADGAVQPQQVVSNTGTVTLTRKSYRTLIGLHFDSYQTLLSPEFNGGAGTAQGNSMRCGEISVRFLDSMCAEVYDGDGEKIGDLSFKQFGNNILDQVPMPFSGIKRIEALGWERGRSEITITQKLPLPQHVLAVVRKVTINEG